MILEQQKQATVLQSGQNNKSIGMSLDLESAQVLMQMLSKNLYSDAIGSTVRECASNALDSHRRAGVTDPIIVSLVANDNNSYEFSVEDFGIGLDDKDVESIISKYGKSTKRDSNVELGMMGLGFKAPLAYTSSFYFVCRKDGVERKYMMYEGEDVNTIDLLYTKSTDERNGVKVIVPIKWGDKYDFKEKIQEQLAYFSNVFLNVSDINNNFLIHRSNLFQFSELATDKSLHICLDDVYYPLDFDKLGIDRIYLPIALRFSLSDGLFPTPNRESLRYTPEAKKVIMEKIVEFANDLTSRYNKSIQNTSDPIEILNYYANSDRRITLFGVTIHYNEISKYATIPITTPKLIGVDNLDLSLISRFSFKQLLSEYSVTFRLSNNRMYSVKKHAYRSNVAWDDDLKDMYYYITPFKGNKKNYMREFASNTSNTVSFVKKTKSHELGNANSRGMDTYYDILDLGRHPKSEWRGMIKDWQYIESLLIDKMTFVDDINVPQQWLDDRKQQRLDSMQASKQAKGPKLEGEINCKIGEPLQRYSDGKNCKFVAGRVNIKNIEEGTRLYVYANHNDSDKLDKLYGESYKFDIKYISLSTREISSIEDSEEITNLISYDDFISGHEYYTKLTTSLYTHKFLRKHDNIFNRKGSLKNISDTIGDALYLLDSYTYKHVRSGSWSISSSAELMVKHAEDNNLLDESIVSTINNLDEIFKTHWYLSPMCRSIMFSNKWMIEDCIAQLLRCNGFDINESFKFHSPDNE